MSKPIPMGTVVEVSESERKVLLEFRNTLATLRNEINALEHKKAETEKVLNAFIEETFPALSDYITVVEPSGNLRVSRPRGGLFTRSK